MKLLKKALRLIFLLLAVAALAVFIVASYLRKSGLPSTDGEQKISGINSEIRVLRDERGMPHIYAANMHDLYFATGYVTAQERLWQMDLIRRATRGRLSEIFGPSYVEADHFLRLLNMTAKSETVLAREDPAILAAMQAYCEGVNKWIEETGKRLPAEFRVLGYTPEPWTLTDITNIIGYMGWELAKDNLSDELWNYRLVKKFGVEKAMSMLPDWSMTGEVVFPEYALGEGQIDSALTFIASLDKVEKLGAISLYGSNNWAAGPSRTESGKPLMSNDMHLGLSIPGYWMQIHQVVDGELNVTGVMVPGQPFVVAGHNENIAWGMTNLMVDDIDLFAERVDTAGRYLFNGEWLPMTEREEIIKIKGGATETVKVRSTHRGPVISELKKVDDAVLTMRWSGYDYSDEVRGVYLLNRASDWNSFRNAVSNFRSVSQNFVYADRMGNIGLNTGGGIPIRKGSGLLPRNGETGEYDWKGYVPFELLPFSLNPEGGFVSSANQQTVSKEYPWYISGSFVMPWRIMRIRQMAGEKEKMGMDDFRRMITDNHSAYAAMLTPLVVSAAENEVTDDAAVKKAIGMLSEWDYDMNAARVAPSLFEFTRAALARNLLADELGDLYGGPQGMQHDYYIYKVLTEGPDGWVDNVNTPEKETFEQILAMSLRQAVDTLTERYGSNMNSWKWGRIHTITLEHPMGSVKILDRLLRLNSRTKGIDGSYHTVEPYSFDSEFRTNHGASERHIFNTADWDKSITVIPTGTSGNPGSPFYLSQTAKYLGDEFYPEPFSREAVEKAAKYELVLKPE